MADVPSLTVNIPAYNEGPMVRKSIDTVATVKKDALDHTHIPIPFLCSAFRDNGMPSNDTSSHIIMRIHIGVFRVYLDRFPTGCLYFLLDRPSSSHLSLRQTKIIFQSPPTTETRSDFVVFKSPLGIIQDPARFAR